MPEDQLQAEFNAYIDTEIRRRENATLAFLVTEAKALPKSLIRVMLLELGQFYEELKE